MTDIKIYEVSTVADMARVLGALGGASKSDKKIQASKENGKKGGRPKNIPPTQTVSNLPTE